MGVGVDRRSPIMSNAARLLNCFSCLSFAQGDIIVRQGEVGREMYFIAQGTVEVSSQTLLP